MNNASKSGGGSESMSMTVGMVDIFRAICRESCWFARSVGL